MAAKATPGALRLIDKAKKEKDEPLSKRDVVRVVAPAYIPAIIMGASTIACIFGANVLNKRQQASIASAYMLLDRSHKRYKAKLAELYGEDADRKITHEIAKDGYTRSDIAIEDHGEKRLFYDSMAHRYFECSMETILQAEYEMNRDISLYGRASINDFYRYIGIPKIEAGDTVGWCEWIDFVHEKAFIDDDLECYIVSPTAMAVPC